MLDVSSLPAEPFLFLCRELSDRSQCETVQFDMLFDVHLWVLSFTTQRKASPCHLLGVMAGITQLANSCSSAGCGLMHLASEACTALLGITLSSATVRNSVHTTCSVGDVPFFLVERLPLGGLDQACTHASRPCWYSKAWELAKEPCLALFLVIRLSWLSSSVPSFFSLLVAWEFTPVCEINDADIAVFVTGSMFDAYRLRSLP